MKKKIIKIQIIMIFVLFMCMTVSFGEYKEGDTVYAIGPTSGKNKGWVQLYYGSADDKVQKSIEDGTKLKITLFKPLFKKGYIKADNRYYVTYDKDGRKAWVNAGDIIDHKSTQEDGKNKVSKELDKFIADQKDRIYENLAITDPDLLLNTYNTASVYLNKATDEGQRTELRKIMTDIYNAFTKKGWKNLRRTEDGRIAWDDENGKTHYRSPEDANLNEKEDMNQPQQPQEPIVIYYAPENRGSQDDSSGSSIDDAISDAENFLTKIDTSVKTVGESDLQNFSNSFYNIFLTAGTAIAVIVGIIIGIQYMLGSVEQKADFKKLLIPYAVGCIVVFGSFGIWKMVLEILEKI